MAFSVHPYVGDGSTTEYAVNFTLGYLDKTHVQCTVEDEVDGLGDPIPRTLTWITDNLVDIGAAPASGLQITIRRITPKTALVHDYQDGAVMAEASFDESNLQNLMISHELLDGFVGESAVRQYDEDMAGFKITNLGTPTLDTDAVTKLYVDATLPALVAAAELAESNAADSETAAALSQAAASLSATQAQYRAWEAEAEKMTADAYATTPEDTFVSTYASDGDGTFTATVTTDYSALHHAAKAEQDALSVNTDHDSLVSVMLPTDWPTVNKAGWDHFGFNQQWGGAPWGGRLPDGTDGEVATGSLISTSTISLGAGATSTYKAQGFKTPVAISCDKAIISVSKVGNPTANIEVYIYDDNAGSPGTLVTNGTATPQAGTLHSSEANEVVFTFPTPPSLIADTQYHLVMKASAIDGANYWLLAGDSAGVYPFGYQNTGDATPTWTPTTANDIVFKIIPTAATATIKNGEFSASDTTQFGQAPALTKKIGEHILFDKDGKFTHHFRVGAAPTASKPLCQAYYDNDTHITVETDASQHAIIRSNGSTITGTSVLAADDAIGFMYDGTQLHLYVNGVEEGTAITVSYPDNFDTGSFIVGGAIPTDLTWTKETDMSLLPSADGWTFNGTATEANAFSVSGGKLYQNAAGFGANTGYYSKAATFNNATGWRVDTEVQVLDSSNGTVAGEFDLQVQDGTKLVRIFVHEHFMEVYGSANIGYIQGDFKSKSNQISMLGKGSDFYIFVNGKLAFDGTGLLTATTAGNQVIFGDQTVGNNADVIWHYVNYIESYEAPTFTTTPLYDFGSCQKDASSLLPLLATSDVKSVFGLKEDWVNEKASRSYGNRGIVSAPTTATTTYAGVPDLPMFAIGSDFSINAENTYTHDATSAHKHSLKIDGKYVKEEDIFMMNNSAGFLNTAVINCNHKSPCGLHFIEPVWAIYSTGTMSAWTNRRHHDVVGR